jgi:hypothetical protein
MDMNGFGSILGEWKGVLLWGFQDFLKSQCRSERTSDFEARGLWFWVGLGWTAFVLFDYRLVFCSGSTPGDKSV